MTQGSNSPRLDVKKILRERARSLARPPRSLVAAEAGLSVVHFTLAQEYYAVETSFVREVYPLRDLTVLPCTPPFIKGIVSLRGRILPVLDIRKFFDIRDDGLTDVHHIVHIHGHNLELGLLADTVSGVRSIPVEALQPSLPTFTGIRADYLKGVTTERVVVLDVNRLLTDPKITVHEEVRVELQRSESDPRS